MLTDDQIERYSRQIILPQVGGFGQERLLAARVRVLAEIEDLTPALEYLAGAGIGRIRLDPATPITGDFVAAVKDLNPEVRIEPALDMDPGEMLLVLAGSERVIDAARRINQSTQSGPMIFARLGAPYLIAALGKRPPCLACAAPALLCSPTRGDCSVLTSIAAAAETIGLLLTGKPHDSRLIQINDYELRPLPIAGEGCAICDSARGRGPGQ